MNDALRQLLPRIIVYDRMHDYRFFIVFNYGQITERIQIILMSSNAENDRGKYHPRFHVKASVHFQFFMYPFWSTNILIKFKY
jgi:hypothetical protein